MNNNAVPGSSICGLQHEKLSEEDEMSWSFVLVLSLLCVGYVGGGSALGRKQVMLVLQLLVLLLLLMLLPVLLLTAGRASRGGRVSTRCCFTPTQGTGRRCRRW